MIPHHRQVSHTHTHPFNGPFSGTIQQSRCQKGKSNLDFTEARDSEWQWHQLGHMQVCTSLQTDDHASTPPLCFLQAGCPSCHPTNSVKALKAHRQVSTTKNLCTKLEMSGYYSSAATTGQNDLLSVSPIFLEQHLYRYGKK